MLTAENAVAAYTALFDPLTRAAHRACLEHAVLSRPDGWPTLTDCLAFAGLYGIASAPFAAFFGYVSRRHGQRVAWVDVLNGDPGTWESQHLMGDDQARALGFQIAFGDVVAGRRPR